MKKLLALIVIVLFLGNMFAAESDPSDVVGYIEYSLITTSTTNSNLVAVSLDNGVTTAQGLANEIGAAGVVDAVSKFDAASQSWSQVTYSFVPFPPPGSWQWSGDFDIYNGDVLMVNVTADTDYYCAGDIFVFPSLYEAFSLATLEAAASGLPIIATKINGTEELIKEGYNGFFVKRDPKDITEKINLLIKDENLRKQMSRNARKVIEKNYTWDICAKKTTEVYEELLRR